MAMAVIPLRAEPLAGQDHESRFLSDRFQVALGGFLVDFDTAAAVGNGRVLGTVIQLEDDLNLDSNQTVIRLDGMWRIRPKHALEYGCLSLDRDALSILEEEFEFQGKVYEVDAIVASEFKNTLFRLGYRYSFLNNGKVDTGFIAGLSTYDYNIALSVEGTVSGQPPDEAASGSQGLILPIPTVGLFTNFAITPRLILRGEVSVLDLDIGDYKGKLTDSRITFDSYIWRHVGVGGGLSTTDLEVSKRGEDPFRVQYEYSGLLFYVTSVF